MDLSLPVASRLAPTPSGFLHLGNAASFVLTWLYVRKLRGNLWLRIDDLDSGRSRPEYIEDIFRSLEWLGLDWDEGPTGPDDFEKQFSQRHRLDLYHDFLQDLRTNGHVFACDCSRKSIREISPDGQYPGTCRDKGLSLTQPGFAHRVYVPDGTLVDMRYTLGTVKQVDLSSEMKDFVVLRKDGIPAYQVASLVDDWEWKINLIVRGEDLISSTAAQLFLWPLARNHAFDAVRKIHHPLILDKEQKKLSKSEGAYSLKDLRDSGASPDRVYQLVADWLGISSEAINSPEALLERFKVDQIVR